MKDNLEKAFKNSLEEYEAPYDPKAWETVNQQLNANAGGGASVFSNALKWGAAVVLVGIVVSASYLLWNNTDNSKTNQIVTVENEKQEATPLDKNKEKNTEQADSSENSSIPETKQKDKEEKDFEPIIVDEKEPVNKQEQKTEEVKENDHQKNENNLQNDGNQIEELPNKDIPSKFIAGNVSISEVCAGEVVTIRNSSNNDKVRFKANGEWITLSPKKKYLFAPKESVVINFVNNKEELIETEYIKVNELPTPDFDFEANIFEKGLPVVLAESYGDYAKYQWTFDNNSQQTGSDVSHSFFDKGDHEIQLKVTDMKGCEGTKIKTVNIRNKYNLMAMDAFKPNGSDVRNRTFMPYSLKEREVRFRLTIIDPIDNGVVFTSNEAVKGWDGTDQRTGKITPSNKAYIWKVQILTPVEGERPVYAGTIVHN